MSGAIAAAAQWASSILMLLKMAGLGYLLVKMLDFMNTIRSISFYIDKMILKLIDKMYYYFTILVNNEFFDETTLEAFAGRIYLFIGIVIFFKLAMTVIKFISDPDKVSDERAGMGAILKKSIVGIVLIAVMPTIFDVALKLQGAIIKDNVIQYIITGEKINSNKQEKYTVGQNIGFTVFNGFATVNTAVASKTQEKQFTRAHMFKDADLIDSELITTKNGDAYVVDYFPVVSTAVLAFVLFNLLTMTLNVVVRIVELGVLEIISPIIIIDYMVDTGKDTFSNWMKATVSAYVKIFIDVAMLWFIVFILNYLTDPSLPSPLIAANQNDKMLIALIVIGLFLFTKKIPGIISKIFGIDLDSTTSDFLKGIPGKVMGAGRKVLGGAKTIGGMYSGAAKQGMRFGASALGAKRAGAGFGGAMAAGMRGATANSKMVQGAMNLKKDNAQLQRDAYDREKAKSQLNAAQQKLQEQAKTVEAKREQLQQTTAEIKVNTDQIQQLQEQLKTATGQDKITLEANIKTLQDSNTGLQSEVDKLQSQIKDVEVAQKVKVNFSDDASTLQEKVKDIGTVTKTIKYDIDTSTLTKAEVQEATATFKAAELSGKVDVSQFTNAGDLKDAMEKVNAQMQDAAQQATQAQSEAMQKMVQQQAQMTSQMQQATQQMNASQAQMAKAVEQVAEQQKKFNDAVDAGVEVLSDMIDDVENNNK